MIRFEIRAAGTADEEQLLRLARHLNTVNLPNDRPHIQKLLAVSADSFSQRLAVPKRKYVFVLWDLEKDLAVGTSMIVSQLGRRDAPYIYFDVLSEEKYSPTVDKHFHHTALRLGFSYAGPTELGGLVVDPDYRASKERLGLLISYVRFLFIAIHRDLFQKEVLAELLPPLEPDGTSHLWEALGRRFTEMSYAEADLLSSENKSFVRDLFPTGMIYATLLSQDAQAVIGKVGAQTKGVERMLQRVGFRYAERVDPFDGGPHFVANTDDVTLVEETEATKIDGPLGSDDKKLRALVARELPEPPYFRAISTCICPTGRGRANVDQEALSFLGLAPGDELICLPLR